MDLRVATYNVHGGVGRDGRFDLERVAAVIAELDADVVALQEVGDVRGRGPAVDHAAALAARAGRAILFHPVLRQGERGYGNAVLTRLPVESTRTYDLSVARREKRGCLRADVRLGDAVVHVFALHLGLARHEQRAQTAMLLGADILKDAALSYPLVVLGDFNFWFPGPVARTVRRALQDAAVAAGAPRPTYPAGVPLLRLDRVYVDTAWDVVDARVHTSPLAELASDHLPLVVQLRLRAGAPHLPAGTGEAEAEAPARSAPERVAHLPSRSDAA